jgi:hypothetical protein
MLTSLMLNSKRQLINALASVVMWSEFLAADRGPGFDSRCCQNFLDSSGSATGSNQPL